MPNLRNSHKNKWPGTYFVQARKRKGKKEEITRLEVEDWLTTTTMEGPLAEQSNPAAFRRVLDVACGVGGWAIEAAQAYPEMSLVGIDANHMMVETACARAAELNLADRVSFQVMDALARLEFPNESFDLVNMRVGSSFLRTWEWPELLLEFLRVLRPGGVARITEPEMVPDCSSPALWRCTELLLCAMFRAGHFYEEEITGITAHLPRLLTNHGWKNVQTRAYMAKYQADTPEGKAYSENMVGLYSLRPFLEKWGCHTEEFEQVYRQMLKEVQQDDFYAWLKLVTVWGVKPHPSERKNEL